MQNASISPAYNRIPSDGVTPFVMQIDDSLRFPTAGCRYFRVLAATAALHIRFDDGPEIPMRAGMSYRAPVNFSWVTITNRSGAANTIDLVWSDGEITDDALQLSGTLAGIASTVTVNQVKGSSFGAVVDVSVPALSQATVSTSSASRRRHYVSNPSTNAYPFRIGGSTTPTATSGFELQPGEMLIIETTTNVKAFNLAPYPQTITATQEND